MTKQNLALGFVAIVAVLFAFSWMAPKPTVVDRIVEKTVGSVTGPDSFFSCESHNGITRCFNRSGLTTGTSTPCNFKSPNATSTLVSGSIKFTTGTTSYMIVQMGKGPLMTSTSTNLVGSYYMPAGAQATVLSTTSPTDLQNNIFAPNTWFTVGLNTSGTGVAGGSVVTNLAPTGFCQATFETVQ